MPFSVDPFGLLRVLLLVGPLLLYGPCKAHSQRSESAKVTVHGTTFVGRSQTVDLNGLVDIDFFGGIPFAEPPLNELRFAAPIPRDTRGGKLVNATEFGASCVQLDITDVSEDCLTLNIFRPAPTNINFDVSLPVLVWIYGGGFAQGVTNIFDASAIIAQSIHRGTPVVYVSINYRVGPFGFPQGSEAGQQGAVNLGLKDQLAGLEWVKRNIKAFGGDPEKVTVFGQSAGAMSIGELYLNSDLEKLVRGAILESGSASSLPWFNASRREVVWDTLVANVPECANTTQGGTFSCLRTVDTSTLLAAWQTTAASFPEPLVFVPVLDGPTGLVPDLPSRLYAQGKFARIPFIAGTNLDEGTDSVPRAIATEAQLVQLIAVAEEPFATALPENFGQDVAALLQLYPDDPAQGSPFGTGNETFGLSSTYKRAAALVGDANFQAPRRAWMRAASTAGVRAFGYYFTDLNAVTDASQGVAHANELPYVYGLTAQTSNDPAVRLLSSTMVDYWISFTVSLTPNDGKGIPKTVWPEYNSDQQVLLQFDALHIPENGTFATFAVIPDDYHAEQISFLSSIQEDQHV